MTTIERVINECEIRYHGELISREAILRDFACEIERLATTKGHSIGIMLHTGSKLFTVAAMIVASVLCISSNNIGTEEIVESLCIGDNVIIDNKRRAKYLGRKEIGLSGKKKEYYSFEVENKSVNSYPVECIADFRIVPYQGESQKLSGVGVRKTSFSDRLKFISYIWDSDEKDVSSLITKSFIFLTGKVDAADIYGNTTIKINNNVHRLLDIVTASYFTENKEYKLGPNVGKEIPVLMIYSDIQEARKALIDDSAGENRIAGLFAIGDEYLKNGAEKLLSRQSTSAAYYSGKLDYSYSSSYANFADNAEFWSLPVDCYTTCAEYPRSKLLKEFKLGARALNGDLISKVSVPDGISTESYRKIQNSCRWLKENAHDAEEFIVQCFSFTNLLVSSIFPLFYLDEAMNDIELGRIDSTVNKIERIRILSEKFQGKAKEKAVEIINALSIERKRIYNENPKGAELVKILSGRNRPQAIIVPKAYYGHVLKKWIGDSVVFAGVQTGVQIITVAEARHSDMILDSTLFACAGFGTTNPQNLLISPERRMLIYDCECVKAKLQEKSFLKEKKSVLSLIGQTDLEIDALVEECPISEEEKNEIDTEKMITEMLFSSVDRASSRFSADGMYPGAKAEIFRIVIFSGGDYAAYFTKRSSVYRVHNGKVEDIDVSEIAEGDILLFANNDEGRDLFKVFMKNLIEESPEARNEFEEAYNTSLQWRGALNRHIKLHGGVDEFVRKLKEYNIERDPVTIRLWADEDSHIIGPSSSEAEKIFTAIGNIVGNTDIITNAKKISDACSTVRLLRIKMLDAVKKIVINKFNGNDIGALFAPLAQNIGKLAIMMQVERVKDIKTVIEMPAYRVNRPIEI